MLGFYGIDIQLWQHYKMNLQINLKYFLDNGFRLNKKNGYNVYEPKSLTKQETN